jgi:uncharacterized protein (TIGR03089 family)
MADRLAQTVVDILTQATRQAARPLVTYYDDATDERTELSGATVLNWVAKTANLVRDGAGLAPGDVAAVRLPAHWQSAVVLLGCWSAGLVVDLDGAGGADVAFVADGVPAPAGIETYALALAPLGLPFRPGPPPGTADYVVEVRGHGDHFTPAEPVRPQTPALADGTTHAALVGAARARGLAPGARVLVDGDRSPDPVDWLLAPLAAGGSVVLCRHLDPARVPARLVDERAVALGG